MNIYIYRNYVSNNEETLSDKIFDLLCEDYKDIGRVETQVESAWEDVEELQASVMRIFELMDQGYIFLNHCVKEEL